MFFIALFFFILTLVHAMPADDAPGILTNIDPARLDVLITQLTQSVNLNSTDASTFSSDEEEEAAFVKANPNLSTAEIPSDLLTNILNEVFPTDGQGDSVYCMTTQTSPILSQLTQLAFRYMQRGNAGATFCSGAPCHQWVSFEGAASAVCGSHRFTCVSAHMAGLAILHIRDRCAVHERAAGSEHFQIGADVTAYCQGRC